MSIPSSGTRSPGEQEPDRERIRAGDPQARAGAAPDVRPGPEQDVQALRVLPGGRRTRPAARGQCASASGESARRSGRPRIRLEATRAAVSRA